jgi:hypothetical protein
MIEFYIFFSWLIFVVFFFRIYKYQKKFIYFNASVLVFSIFLIYYSLPILFNIYFFNNYIDESRLEILQITDSENLYMASHILSGSMGFLISCFFFKYKNFSGKFYEKNINLILILSFLILFFFLLNFFFQNQFDMSNFNAREDSYLFARNLNIVDRYILKFLGTAFFFLKVILLFKLIQYFSKKKIFIWIAAFFYLFYVYYYFDMNDQRSEHYMFFVIFIVSYNLFVKEQTVFKMSIFVISSLLFFTLWSYWRGSEDVLWTGLGEFDHIYANAIDIIRVPNETISIKKKIYDFYSFIPSIILPFEKSTLVEWYLKNYHEQAYELGQGFAFGILAESIYGYGILETFLKTLILSLFLNYFYIKYLYSKNIYIEFFYIILFITSPLAIRVTAFYFLSDVIQFGIIISILVYFFLTFFKRKNKIIDK